MKLFKIIFIILIGTSACAQNWQEQFLQANKLYQEGDVATAYSLYDEIEHKGSAVWFNMGNCLYHMGEYVQALVCWKRAQMGATLAERSHILTNIGLLHDQIAVDKQTNLWFSLQAAINRIPLALWQLLLICLWILFLLIVLWLYRMKRYDIITFFVVILLICVFVIWTKYSMRMRSDGIILQQDLALRSGPSHDCYQMAALDSGVFVAITGECDGWCQVTRGATIGWIPDETVARIS